MDGAVLKIKGLGSEEFQMRWARRLGYKTEIEDPENPGEMIPNIESRSDFLTKKIFEQGQQDAENDLRDELKVTVDDKVKELKESVEIDHSAD